MNLYTYKCALKIQSLFILIGVWCIIFLAQYIFDNVLVLNYLTHKQNYFGAIIWISLTMHFLERMENEQKLAQITIKNLQGLQWLIWIFVSALQEKIYLTIK